MEPEAKVTMSAYGYNQSLFLPSSYVVLDYDYE